MSPLYPAVSLCFQCTCLSRVFTALSVFFRLSRMFNRRTERWWLVYLQTALSQFSEIGFLTCCSYTEPLRSTGSPFIELTAILEMCILTFISPARRRTQLAFAVHTLINRCAIIRYPRAVHTLSHCAQQHAVEHSLPSLFTRSSGIDFCCCCATGGQWRCVGQ